MTELELVHLTNIVKAQGEELAKLRTLVLEWIERSNQLVERQRINFAQQVGSSEDFLDTFYDRSLLARRREKVQRSLPVP